MISRYLLSDFAAVDGDTDLDIVLAGSLNCEEPAKLFINDGTGSYSQVLGIPFYGTHSDGMVTFEEIGNGGAEDLFSRGSQNPYVDNECITVGYFNNNYSSYSVQNLSPSLKALAPNAVNQRISCNANIAIFRRNKQRIYTVNKWFLCCCSN